MSGREDQERREGKLQQVFFDGVADELVSFIEAGFGHGC
jgi:hypothetical protein